MPPGRWRGDALGGWSGALAIPLLFILPTPPLLSQEGPAQEPPASRESRTPVPIEEILRFFNRVMGDASIDYDSATGEVMVFYPAGVEGTFQWRRPDGKVDPVNLQADRVLIVSTVEKTPATPPAEGEKKDAPAEARPASRFTPPRLYAEGNVRLGAKGMVLETDAFFYDEGKKRGLAVGVRGHADLESVSRLGQVLGRQELFHLDPDIGSLAEPLPEEGPPQAAASGGAPGKAAEAPVEGASDLERPRVRSKVLSVRRILALRAETLRLLDLEHFEGQGVVISACEFGVPHFGVRSGAAKVYPAPALPGEDTSGEGPEGERRRHAIIESEGNRVELGGAPVLPLPPLRWNTEWAASFPIRRIQPGHSSKYGYRMDVDWNLNWFLDRTPLTRLDAARLFLDESRLSFATDYLSKRGFGWGPDAIYGLDPPRWGYDPLRPRAWTWYGESGYWSIRDHADEDRFGDVPIEDPDRHWTHVAHRQSIPYLGVLDVEVSERSDENFLNEYFERVAKQEKEQESLVYLRRQLRDNIALTGLYKYRLDDFETVVERMPEGKAFFLEQPLGRSGFYDGLVLQAAQLRRRPEEDSGLPSQESGRLDALNELAYPFGVGPRGQWLRFRPFVDARGTLYERGVDPEAGSIDRGALGAGTDLSQEWSRVFHYPAGGIAERWFGFRQLKHVVIPRTTYRNIFINDTDPSELIQFDEVDALTTDERVQLSLRNELLARRPGRAPRPLAGSVRAGEAQKIRPDGIRPLPDDLTPVPTETRLFLDTEVSVDWFPLEERDNEGKEWGLLDLDVTFRPSDRFWIHTRTFFDPTERMRFERTDSGVTVLPLENVRWTVGERFTRDETSFTYTLLTVELSQKYLFDVYYAYDFEENEQSDIELRITRIAHEWAIELNYGFDAGEGDNHSFSVNIRPAWLLADLRDRRDRGMTPGR